MKIKISILIAVTWLGLLSNAFAILQWPLTVTNIAELKSLSVQDVKNAESAYVSSINPVVFVMGYYTSGDRGGGPFEWQGDCTATPDGGRYITTNGWTSGAGRWVRMLNGETANVKMWGA